MKKGLKGFFLVVFLVIFLVPTAVSAARFVAVYTNCALSMTYDKEAFIIEVVNSRGDYFQDVYFLPIHYIKVTGRMDGLIEISVQTKNVPDRKNRYYFVDPAQLADIWGKVEIVFPRK